MQVLLDYIKENNASMVLVTHDESMAKLCDKRYRLENQKVEGF
jgi:putative ABC transport system ATP-binding protein